MSMFRRPGEDSSSSSEESSEGRTGNEGTSLSQGDNILSRIRTLDSAPSGLPSSRQPPSRPELPRNNSQVRDLLLHSLMEEKALRDAAEYLGKDTSDPEVQKVARETYQALSRQISNNVDEAYASEEMRTHRITAHEGITRVTRGHLTALSVTATGGGSQALVARNMAGMSLEMPPTVPAGLESLLSIPQPLSLPLQGYPGLHNDRYRHDFTEVDVVGKGGYGKVFRVKHKLDGSFYAVKRIMVSPAKLQKIREHGTEELENMLEEVRSLARFDHGNIVRYHNAWLELTTGPSDVSTLPVTTSLVQTNRWIRDPNAYNLSTEQSNGLHASFNTLSVDDSFRLDDHDIGADIVFGNSDTGPAAEESRSEADHSSLKEQNKSLRARRRRGSRATIATISSTRSGDPNEEDDEDVEMIPRSDFSYSRDSASDLSQSMVSHSDVPGHLVPTRTTGPILTLNVQMSLYETNLAAFLSSEQQSFKENPQLHHCFHPCISLELLSKIIRGVDYLHSRGVVHRDLKPANIFLSLSTSRVPPSGSVNLSSCKTCPDRDCLHVTPRIGDFGLVAALDDKYMTGDHVAKPVGTEFYRPETCGRISEKLDVFALGVVGFEMLHKFGTRMERVDALSRLRRGQFPPDFSSNIGVHGSTIESLLSDMVHVEEEKRLSCEGVKKEIGRLVHVFRA